MRELASYGAQVEVFDPWVNSDEARALYNVRMVEKLESGRYDAVVAAVAHREFSALEPAALRACCREQVVIYDVKHSLPSGLADASL